MLDLTQRHHRLLISAGIAVGGTLCAPALTSALATAGVVGTVGVVGAAIGTAIGAAAASVATGVFANDVITQHTDSDVVRLRGSRKALANEDLIKASGLAVGLLIKSVAESGNYRQDKENLGKLALYATQEWTGLIAKSREGNLPALAALQEEELNAIFAKEGKEFFEQEVLTVSFWQTVIEEELCQPHKIVLEPKTMTDLVETLCGGVAKDRDFAKVWGFAKALREVLKADFEGGGKAFAGLTLSMLGEILAILRNPAAQGVQGVDLQPVLAALNQMEELQKQLSKTQGAEFAAITTGQELMAQRNEAGFKVLGQKVDSGFEAVMAALGIQGEQIQDLQNWLQGKLEDISQQLRDLQVTADRTETKVDSTETKVTDLQVTAEEIKEKLENIEGFFQAQQESKVENSSFKLNISPPTVSCWQGRERDLALVNEWLTEENTKLGVIVGIGGLGKSTLAAKVYHERTDFVGKMWIDLGNRPNFTEVVKGILKTLGKATEEQLKDLEQRTTNELIQGLVYTLQQERFLLVWDNLETVIQDAGYQEFLRDWLGKCHKTEVLVTTQELPRLMRPRVSELALAGLEPTAGAKLLRQGKVEGTIEELEAFSRQVQGHPLTLSLVAGFLADKPEDGMTLGKFGNQMRLLFEKLEGDHRQELVYLVAVLDASFGRLAEKLQRVLLALVVVRGNFDAEMAAAISGESVTNQELRSLGKRGFLTIEESGKYTFQPFILEYLKYKAGDLTTAHHRAIEFYQSCYKPCTEWQTVADVQEYLEVFYHLCQLGEYPAAFDVLRGGDDVDKFLSLRGNNQILVELYQQLIIHLPDHKDWRYTASLTSLGIAYSSLGCHQEAINFYQQSLVIDREIGDRQGEAASLNNLGNAYKSLGCHQEAINFYQQSLVIDREIGDRQGEAISLGNLGNAYDSLGRYQEAINFQQQSLVIDREIGDRQGEAASLNNLGNAYKSLGRYQEAIDLHQQSLVIEREIGHRQGEANSLGNLGNAYNSLGRYQKAIDFHQQSLVIEREIGHRQGEANSLGSLGNAYNSLGRYQEAIDKQQESLVIKREIGDRLGEAISLSGLGSAYQSLGRYQDAISYYEQSLLIKQEIEDKRGAANSLLALGGLYQQVGRIKEGFAASQQANLILQELDLPLDAYPFPNWIKKLIKFAQSSNLKFILCLILGIFAFPFALVAFLLLTLFRLLRSRLPRP